MCDNSLTDKRAIIPDHLKKKKFNLELDNNNDHFGIYNAL